MKEQILIGLDNPMLRDHQVHGQHVLSGMAYADILYQIFRQHGHDFPALELRNLSIYQPLIVAPDLDVLLDIEWSEVAKGGWQIEVSGRERRRTALSPVKTRYVTAQMMRLTEPVLFSETIDFEAIRKSASAVVDFSSIYETYRRNGLVHGDLMRAEGKLYATDSAVYLDIALTDTAVPSASSLMFHPALMDCSVACSGGAAPTSNDAADARLYLPVYYESFTATALMQRHCTARIQLSSARRGKELAELTVEYFDSSGRKIAQLGNFAAKLVRQPHLIRPERRATTNGAHLAIVPEIAAHEPRVPAAIAPVESGTADEGLHRQIELFLRELMATQANKSVEEVRPEAGFYELGLDSAMLMDLARTLEAKTGASLAPTLLFEYTTVGELTRYLADNHAASFRGKLAETAPMAEPAVVETTSSVPAEARIDPAPPEAGVREPIAIIGVSGRFPQARTTEALWQNLVASRDCITEVPGERWSLDEFFDPDPAKAGAQGKSYNKWGGFLEGADEFDLQFFPPEEGPMLIAHGRHLLEVMWNLLESAGYTRESLVRAHPGRVGVYLGAMSATYGYASAICSTASWFFDCSGPCVAVDTASSSSMTAIHLACEALTRGDCEVAIVAGMCLLSPQKFILHSMMRTLGTSQNARSFTNGDGVLLSECVGAVLLKRMTHAVTAADPILAVIKSTSVTHAGSSGAAGGFSVESFARSIADNIRRAKIDARSLSYVESAATGQGTFEQLELATLTKAFREFTQDKGFCRIATVKSNIGHAEAASAMSQLTKVILQMRHRKLIPLINLASLNTEMRLENTPFVLQETLEEWHRPKISAANGEGVEQPLRALITSFGGGGQHGSLILEEYVQPAVTGLREKSAERAELIVLSARNAERVHVLAHQLLEFVRNEPDVPLSHIAYTLQAGREELQSRLALVVSNRDELLRGIGRYLDVTSEPASVQPPVWTLESSSEEVAPTRMRVMERKAKRALLSYHIIERDLAKLGELWVDGAQIPWDQLHAPGSCRRVQLPTYPFERLRASLVPDLPPAHTEFPQTPAHPDQEFHP